MKHLSKRLTSLIIISVLIIVTSICVYAEDQYCNGTYNGTSYTGHLDVTWGYLGTSDKADAETYWGGKANYKVRVDLRRGNSDGSTDNWVHQSGQYSAFRTLTLGDAWQFISRHSVVDWNDTVYVDYGLVLSDW